MIAAVNRVHPIGGSAAINGMVTTTGWASASGPGEYPCPQCSRTYRWKDPLGFVRTTQRRRKCGQYFCHCGKAYRYLDSLYKHQKWECGKDPQFQCPHCPHRSKRRSNLGIHMRRRHPDFEINWEGAWPGNYANAANDISQESLSGAQYRCGCGNSYRYERNLKMHQKRECGKEPSIICPHCSYRSKQKSHMKRHIRCKHGVLSATI
ncbi:Longitudinals lacking protein, isoform G [Frankliniella fusca]|uniref:Longitudinals lacking protein, isoform G n=1 Tax=Frankliniella fusca TaxID=407009 RepID=A0AAE1H5Z1_9NEOP|nr:Longitudinals lacking protein, isoform G [Frankliniella fusca]